MKKQLSELKHDVEALAGKSSIVIATQAPQIIARAVAILESHEARLAALEGLAKPRTSRARGRGKS